MLVLLRKHLILVLAMLQFFAPLVHAHTGDKNFNQGLHIPGLESYLASHDATVFQDVNIDWDSEGLLVVVGAGIKNPQGIFVESPKGGVALLPSSRLQITDLIKNDNNFSPQSQSFNLPRLLYTLSPRAPPAQYLRLFSPERDTSAS
jgi:hypothetical protein